MPLKGSGFVAMWHDIDEAGDAEYNRWHTDEHMPERLGIPGFLRGRRFIDPTADRYRYFTLYEAEDLETLGSDAYLARLDAPTEWTLRVQPFSSNFVRSACEVTVSVGHGTGGVFGTIRLDRKPGSTAIDCAAFEALANDILGLDGISGVHVGEADLGTSGISTTESQLRGDDKTFDAIIMLEGYDRSLTENAVRKLTENAALLSSYDVAHATAYDLAFSLSSQETK